MGTVVALFMRYEDADRAVEALTEHGFDRGAVGVVAPESAVKAHHGVVGGRPEEGADGAGGGAMLGGLAGLLVGVVALAIPGVGPLFVAGALASLVASTLAGATAGAAAGGILGALTGLGIPESEARTYVEGVKADGLLVTVLTDREAEARDIMKAANATNIQETPMVAVR
jgi:hypothetical protein